MKYHIYGFCAVNGVKVTEKCSIDTNDIEAERKRIKDDLNAEYVYLYYEEKE